MKCPNCGEENSNKAKFCSNCGKQLKQSNVRAYAVLIFALWIGSFFLMSQLNISEGIQVAWAIFSVLIPSLCFLKYCTSPVKYYDDKQIKICPKCGKKLPGSAIFCPDCGVKLTKE